MRRLISTVLCVLAFASQGTAQTAGDLLIAKLPDTPEGRLAHILRRGTLIVGVKTDYPPWGMIREAGNAANGEIVGIEPDLARALADRLGVGLQLRAVTSDNRLARLNQGLVDVVIATMGDTAERRKQADLIQPNYYSSGVVLYGLSDLMADSWDDLRGQDVCLTQGAYYNRTLEQTYGVVGRYYPGNREARLALAYGRCVGWAFDDTALAQLVRDDPNPAFQVMEETILVAPWAIAVARGNGDAQLGRFVADMVAEWHATGFILSLQDKWQVGQTSFVQGLNETWSQLDGFQPVCKRDPTSGAFPDTCLTDLAFPAVEQTEILPNWVLQLRAMTGIDLALFYDAYDGSRLLRGLGMTLALSVFAIIGALVVGIGLGAMDAILRGWGMLGRLLLLPQHAFVVVARMTPPILQLYIVFFGLAGVLANTQVITPGAFVTAGVILSFYAGATNAVLVTHGMAQERGLHPDHGVFQLLPGALRRSFDGLVAACVNIVKAAGMASAIALPELISTVNLIASEGGDAKTLMNGLLVFYFLLVLTVIWFFKLARRGVVGGAK